MRIIRHKYYQVLFKTIGIVLFILKVNDVIDWSWWLVTMPIWGGFIIGLGVALYDRRQEFIDIYNENK
tara:strand:- start:1264 stop:1467 length:204 start_codon:yes stop_codon:yes gene_type:complete